MSELTQEQLNAAETMSLDELRNLALQEAEGTSGENGSTDDSTPKGPSNQARDEKGRFVSSDVNDEDVVDNSAESNEADDEPQVTIYRKEIDNGNGVIEVFEADSLEELVDKIAEGKRNASIKIRELSQKVKTDTAKTAQESADEDYVLQQRLQKEPKKVIKELLAQERAEEAAAIQRSQEEQERFLATHPDFEPCPENGNRVIAWLRTNGYSEYTSEGLEKAYQDLKASGLLKLKSQEADGTTEENGEGTQRIAASKPGTTVVPSRKKGSTISARAGNLSVPRNVGPTEDELYTMPMDKLKELANKQLSASNE